MLLEEKFAKTLTAIFMYNNVEHTNNNYLVILHRIKAEYAPKSVSFLAASKFNELSIHIRKKINNGA